MSDVQAENQKINVVKQKKEKKKKNNDAGVFRLFGEGLKWFDWVILGVVFLVLFLCYEMRDLYHTAGCSYGFLDGHFLDFYDYLAASGIAEDGSIGLHASYMPTAYIIFAIWNIPMKLFGIVPKATAVLTFVPIMWAKLLPCLVYIISGYPVFLIAKELKMSDHKARITMYAYLSMPIALISQFAIGQYESFLVFFVVMGVYYWMKKKTPWFILFFALAVTLKYTALILFIPLVLLREKRVFPILLQVVLVFVLFGLQYLLFSGSDAFRLYAFGIGEGGDGVMSYITNASYFTGFDLGGNMKYVVYLTYLAFAFVIAYAYFQKPDEREEGRYAMYILCLSVAAMFCFSKWHPHWLMLGVPFWTISAFEHKNTKIFMVIDLIFGALFVMFTVCQFAEICDEVMINNGILKYILPGRSVTEYSSLSDWLGKIDMNIELTLMTAIMAVYAVFKHPKYLAAEPDLSVDKCMGWIRARYIITALVLLIPTALLVRDSLKAYPTAYEETGINYLISLDEYQEITQSFIATEGELCRVNLKIEKGDEFTTGKVHIIVSDETGYYLYEETRSLDSIRSHGTLRIEPHVVLTEGETYFVTVSAVDTGEQMDAGLLGFVGNNDTERPAAEADGKLQDYHLSMTVYQK